MLLKLSQYLKRFSIAQTQIPLIENFESGWPPIQIIISLTHFSKIHSKSGTEIPKESSTKSEEIIKALLKWIRHFKIFKSNTEPNGKDSFSLCPFFIPSSMKGKNTAHSDGIKPMNSLNRTFLSHFTPLPKILIKIKHNPKSTPTRLNSSTILLAKSIMGEKSKIRRTSFFYHSY